LVLRSSGDVVLTVDPDYTFLAMTRFSEGLKALWGKIFQQVQLCVEIAGS
jgi:hypothetical protein